MGAKLAVTEKDEQIEVRQRVKLALGRLINSTNRLEETKASLLLILPEMEDEEIRQLRDKAKELETWSWVVECACDAEMFKRIEEAKRGRGNLDDDESGRVAAARREAYLRGQAVGTIYRNAQLFTTFENILNDQNILQDKGFYEAALRAPDPAQAIEVFAKEKDANAFFSVRDAFRKLEELQGQAKKAKREIMDTFGTLERKAMAQFLEFDCLPAIEGLKTKCPNPDFATNTIESIAQDFRDMIDTIFIEDASIALPAAYDRGYQTDEDMHKFTLLPRPEIHRVMNDLVRGGLFTAEKKTKVTKQQRGTRITQYIRVGEKSGDAFQMPRTESHYETGSRGSVDWGLDD